MERIPPLGWIALALILIITIGVNVNMFSMLRDLNNKKNPRKMKMQRPNTMVNSLKKARDIIRDPLAGEGDKYNELAGLVRDIKAKQTLENNKTNETDPDTSGPKE